MVEREQEVGAPWGTPSDFTQGLNAISLTSEGDRTFPSIT